MGVYLNSKNPYGMFLDEAASMYFIDKSEMLLELLPMVENSEDIIENLGSGTGKSNRYLCITRPRRFGKTVMATMIASFFGKGKDSRPIFEKLKVRNAKEAFEAHINKHNVIYISLNEVPQNCSSYEKYIGRIEKRLRNDLKSQFPDIEVDEEEPVWDILNDIYESEDEDRFIFVLDEWDYIFHRDFVREKDKKAYVEFLSNLLKGKSYVELAYMTGILPIKKYGTQSALTDFREYTMIQPSMLAEYVGFTEQEVRTLCKTYHLDFDEARKWYDGYSFSRMNSVYNPNSIMQAVKNGEFDDYWTETETYESLKLYIDMNLDGLREAIIAMLGGLRCKMNTRTFQNDMSNIKNRDDVLTLLIHLGYLAYDSQQKEVYIPNQEIADEFKNAVEYSGWKGVSDALRASEELLRATIQMDSDTVAVRMDEVHMSSVSVLAYNNEISLSCAVTLAYYTARKDYTIIRECPAGKGFADLAFIPRKCTDKPALLVELKWDQSPQGAIQQIKERKYAGALEEYKDNLLLVGISYDRKSKKHACVIEKYVP